MENVLSAARASGYLRLKDVLCELNVQYRILFWFPGTYFNCAFDVAFVFEEPSCPVRSTSVQSRPRLGTRSWFRVPSNAGSEGTCGRRSKRAE
jgi:hypothetical protein